MKSERTNPWLKFYPQDWRSDEQLRLCGFAARGLWVEMLAIMHRSERYGYLLINGRVPSDAQLAIQAGGGETDVTILLAELEAAGVFSRSGSGVIYSRRMIRDKKKAQKAQENGRNGGNPKLKLVSGKETENSALVKGLDNGGVKGEDKAQKPEARSQSSDTDVSGPDGPPIDPIKALFDLGVEVLADAGERPDRARSLIGKWRRDHGDGEVMSGLVDCRARAISNPVEWMMKRLASARSAEPQSMLEVIAERHRLDAIVAARAASG